MEGAACLVIEVFITVKTAIMSITSLIFQLPIKQDSFESEYFTMVPHSLCYRGVSELVGSSL